LSYYSVGLINYLREIDWLSPNLNKIYGWEESWNLQEKDRLMEGQLKGEENLCSNEKDLKIFEIVSCR